MTGALNGDPIPPGGWALRLDGFEGPLDLLLELARHQKMDLAGISVLALVDQYLDAVEQLRERGMLRLERAADWLVMAEWLTWLKSRLMLPKKTAEAAEAEQAAQVLTDRLTQLEQIRSLATWLEARPQLGRDICLRGAPTEFSAQTVTVDMVALLESCLREVQRPQRPSAVEEAVYRPVRRVMWTMPQALNWIGALLEKLPPGRPLQEYLPPLPSDSPDLVWRRRAAIASTLSAALELAREERMTLRQEAPFGDILVTQNACLTASPLSHNPA